MKWLKNLLQKLGHQVSDEDFAQIEADALAAQAAEEKDAPPPDSDLPPGEPPAPPAEPEPKPEPEPPAPPAPDPAAAAQLAALQAENDALRLDKALTAFLSGKVKDPEAVKPLLLNSGLKLLEDGSIEALEEKFTALQSAAESLRPAPDDTFRGSEPPASDPPPPKALTMTEAIAEKLDEQLERK